jgi:hypothetical protein
MMDRTEALLNNEAKILALWTERVLDTYISSDFFKKSLDRFANPVGGNIREGLAKLFQLLTEGADAHEYAEPLDQIIRIRAVQEFTPSQAVGPLLELKTAVRQIFSADENCRELLAEAELLPFDCAVERMVLQAFDIYMDCRERLHKARIRELKSGSCILTDSACPSALIRENLRKTETVAPDGNCAADKA